MNLISKLLSVGSLMTVSLSIAQPTSDFAYKKCILDPNPKLHQLTEKEKEGSYIILKDEIIIEFAYESSGQLECV